VFGNIDINNGGNGINMTDNTTMNGQIKFTNGYLYIDNYALTLGQDATIGITTLDATHQIILNGVAGDAGVTKIFAANFATSFTFPIGDNGKYTPCTFAFASSNNGAGATIKVIPVDDVHPSITPTPTNNYLDYYWNVSTTGFHLQRTVSRKPILMFLVTSLEVFQKLRDTLAVPGPMSGQ